MLTIGQEVKKLLEKMQETQWVLSELESEYSLTIAINKEEEFIFNYMVRTGMNEMTDKSFWYSWPDEFTGNIVIHHTNIFDSQARNKFVENLSSAINATVQLLANNWGKNTSDPKNPMITNEQISNNTKDMLIYIAEKLNIKNIYPVLNKPYFCGLWGIKSDSQEILDLFVKAVTDELTIPQTTKKELFNVDFYQSQYRGFLFNLDSKPKSSGNEDKYLEDKQSAQFIN
ncbi:Uncharacterised protein [Legionella busanensis]|uniref:Uncharacterized protein n=1 Tax=Legionella busanensis TaxID=190655 RepID=A0A378K8K7_9GAMM|nr:hypothetical protein [Legionella busanensis]STX81278.1 Uncharacterised protein [Legionella busanensis]